MTELSHAARDLIAKARPAELADAAAKQRVRAALGIHLALPPGPPPPVAPVAASTVAAAGSTTKLVLICSLAATGVVGTVAVVKHRHAAERGPGAQRIAHVGESSSRPIPSPILAPTEVGEAAPRLAPVQTQPLPALTSRTRAAGRATASTPKVAPERSYQPIQHSGSEAIGSSAPAEEPLPANAPAAVVHPLFAPSAMSPYPAALPAPPSPQRERPSKGLSSEASNARPAHVTPSRATGEGNAGCSSRSELAFLASAQNALRDGQGERALALLDQHETYCPSAVFWEERSAARVLALCLLHRERQARGEATRLAAHAPSSPQLARLRSSCAAAVIPPTPAQDGR